MDQGIRRIVIVGGGTAGWLSACYLAARLAERSPAVEVTLVESADIPTVGVGEGTWPTMRETLATIGIDEAEFIRQCDASFKQGSRFDGWVDGAPGDSYLHPFTPPPGDDVRALLAAWAAMPADVPFAAAMTAQARVCANHLAPRQTAMPSYAGALNYAYHLDATKLAALLARHATERLNVRQVTATVVGTRRDEQGDLAAIRTAGYGEIEGDLFIDCSGLAGILIGGALGSEWLDLSGEMLNDRALALQLAVAEGSDIESQTIGTAHGGGWIWDIGLPTRRGIGCVYSSRYMSDQEAEAELRRYVAAIDPSAGRRDLAPRLLRFPVGHRKQFWKGNCLAVGLSAGFIEPLEASAIVLIELSLKALADNFPANRKAMAIHADRFNQLFGLRWRRIADFLKLHYVLSRRMEPYWQKHRDPATISPSLAALLELWRDQPPSTYDFPLAEEIFPAASHQYVYFGMVGRSALPAGGDGQSAVHRIRQVQERARQLVSALPSNRAYLDQLRQGDRRGTVREAV